MYLCKSFLLLVFFCKLPQFPDHSFAFTFLPNFHDMFVESGCQKFHFHDCSLSFLFSKIYLKINSYFISNHYTINYLTLMVGHMPELFRRLFLHEKGVWRSQISWIFLIHICNLRKSFFFTVSQTASRIPPLTIWINPTR